MTEATILEIVQFKRNAKSELECGYLQSLDTIRSWVRGMNGHLYLVLTANVQRTGAFND